jgi:D-cysteine desulfhydrase
LDLVEKGAFDRDETVLFWHTGGTPALFSSRYGEMLV